MSIYSIKRTLILFVFMAFAWGNNGFTQAICEHYPIIKSVIANDEGIKVTYKIWTHENTFSGYFDECGNTDPLFETGIQYHHFKIHIGFALVKGGQVIETSDEIVFQHNVAVTTNGPEYTEILEDPGCAYNRVSIWAEHWPNLSVASNATVAPEKTIKNIDPGFCPALDESAEGTFNVLGKMPVELLDKCYCLKQDFRPDLGKEYLFSAWILKENSAEETSYSNVVAQVLVNDQDGVNGVYFHPSGPIIDGWQKIEGTFTAPASLNNYEDVPEFQVKILNYEANSDKVAYVDDVRIMPVKSSMQSFVYNKEARLSSILDDNNYAAFYGYNSQGDLIRINKETERGIMTVKEIRQNRAKK